MDNHPHGMRCPLCMGETRILLRRELVFEPGPRLAPGLSKPRRHAARLTVLLDNIRSAWNVGSILRTADGFGFTHAYLCGITPSADNEAVLKTSLGAEDSVSWSLHRNAVQLVKGLKKEGHRIVALEETEGSLELTRPRRKEDTVLIVGNENTGVDPGLLEICDAVYHIPMRGEKKSFNVAMAFSIAAYTLGK
jgi:tRNA G18 (ribose-2'-O)-methylase SpoU